MELKIKWEVGDGYITVSYDGDKDGLITITSDPNSLWEGRTQEITVYVLGIPTLSKTIRIYQSGLGIDGGMAFTDWEYTGGIDGGISTTKDSEYTNSVDSGASA